ncbi:MAG: OmpH family outer membrane protein [Myxococcales bacterium]|nr:OmpH family outer membrane protein [Myxococcales bacterium]
MSLRAFDRTGLLRLLLTFLVALATTAMSPAARAEGKIAVIDLRRAVADTEDGLRVQAELQELFDNRQADYDSKEKAYTAAKTDFEKLSKQKVSEAELRKKYAALEKMAFDLQQAQMKYRQEMQQKESQLMYPIVNQMLALVRQLASQNSYDMVLNKEAVPYFRSDLDITDRIIQMYNASQGSKGKPAPTPKPKAPAKTPAKAPAPKK